MDAAYSRRTPAAVALLGLSFAVLVALAGCTARSGASDDENDADADQASAQLPTLAGVGGVQDVWPFPFGFDASRGAVESEFGAPLGTEVRPAGSESPATIETRRYPGAEYMFFVDESAEFDQLLSVHITDAEVELNGGLAVGMPVDEALRLMGEPGLRNPGTIVYFFYSTTIELSVDGNTVVAITLSRAMP